MLKVLKNYNPLLTQSFKTSHTGIDIVGNGSIPSLDTIICAQDGIIEKIENNCREVYNNASDAIKVWGHSYGCYILVNHGIINGHNYKTRYAHLQYNSIKVNVGDKVYKGQDIGFMGNTGHTHGAHLHFEIVEDSVAIDPYNYIFGDLDLKQDESQNVNFTKSSKKTIFSFIKDIFSKIIARFKKLYTTIIEKSK